MHQQALKRSALRVITVRLHHPSNETGTRKTPGHTTDTLTCTATTRYMYCLNTPTPRRVGATVELQWIPATSTLHPSMPSLVIELHAMGNCTLGQLVKMRSILHSHGPQAVDPASARFQFFVCESYIGKPIGTRAVPQFTTGVAKPLTQIEPRKTEHHPPVGTP